MINFQKFNVTIRNFLLYGIFYTPVVFNVLHSVQWYLGVDCYHDYHTTLLVDQLFHDYVCVIVKLQAQWYIDFIMKKNSGLCHSYNAKADPGL